VSFSVNYNEVGSAKLFATHRKYLKDRGITDDVAGINNVRSLKPEETSSIWPGRRCETLLIPYSNDYGSARNFGPGPKFLTTGDKPCQIFTPKLPKSFGKLTAEVVRTDPKHAEYLIEGPFKTLSAVSHGLLSIGISGCWNWQKDRQPLPGLLNYTWRKRKTIPLFDADVTENQNVLLPYLLLGDWLTGQGAYVKFMQIPPVRGRKTGVDDYLAKHGKAKFDELVRENWDESEQLNTLRISALRTTEGGLASLFALHYADDVRYDNAEDTWYSWNGTLWERQFGRAPDVQERVKCTVAWIIDEANRIADEKRRKSMRTWGTKCDQKKVIRSAMDLASSDPRLRVSMNDLDRDPWLLGTKSGVVDLRTGTLIESTRTQMVTRSVTAPFDPTAECPRWRKFVREIMCDDREMIRFIYRLVGYLLIGSNPLRLIFFLHGVGRNGKSVFIETLLRLMGDYGGPAKSELIMKARADRDGEAAQPFMLALRGLRYITAAEVREGMQLDAAVVKTLTGGDEMTVRGNYRDPVKFTVEGKIVVRCNHRPIIDGADQAIWDRVVEVPFELRVPDGKEDTTLRDTINEELPGILAWAIRGCMSYQKKGLKFPEKVRKQINAYRDSMDTVSSWFSDCAVAVKGKKVATTATRSSDLYQSYAEWCSQNSRPGISLVVPESQIKFNKALEARKFIKKESNGVTKWYGLQLKAQSS